MSNTEPKPRKLFVFCDGTNNIWKPGASVTNVVKLFRVLDQNDRQFCYYDPGVGTADSKIEESITLRERLSRVAGLAWGDGVWTNIAEAYEWLVREYQDGDQVYLIGFSRGAFTTRALAGLLYWCHLLKPGHANLIPTLIGAYRTENTEARKDICRDLRQYFSRSPNFAEPGFPIELIGVFDTVESVGLSQVILGTQVISDNKVKTGVRFVRHAMAVDESRWTFEPRPYTGFEKPSSGPEIQAIDNIQRLKQVWFPGGHCDVGGGYEEAGLSDLALHWLVDEMLTLPNPPNLKAEWNKNLHPSPFGHRHDEIRRMPLWSLTGKMHRRAMDSKSGLVVSEAVLDRLQKPGWVPPSINANANLKVEPYSPLLREKIRNAESNSEHGKELVDRFSKPLFKGILCLVGSIALPFFFPALVDLAWIQLNPSKAIRENIAGWHASYSLEIALLLNGLAIALTAVWVTTLYTLASERSGGNRRLGYRFWLAGLVFFGSYATETLATAVLANIHPPEGIFGVLTLISTLLAPLIHFASWIKLVAFAALLLLFVVLVFVGNGAPRDRWLQLLETGTKGSKST